MSKDTLRIECVVYQGKFVWNIKHTELAATDCVMIEYRIDTMNAFMIIDYDADTPLEEGRNGVIICQTINRVRDFITSYFNSLAGNILRSYTQYQGKANKMIMIDGKMGYNPYLLNDEKTGVIE